MARAYRVVVARTKGGLRSAATSEWTILETTIRQFAELDSNDDQSFTDENGDPADIGGLIVKSGGWVALAFRDF